jgi:hypothetical protein
MSPLIGSDDKEFPMPDARRPAGPSKPTHIARENAAVREEIEDALASRDDDQPPSAHQPSREQASPQARNETPSGTREKPKDR